MIAEGEDLYDDLYEEVGDMLLLKAPFQSFHENDTREEEFKKKEAELNGKVESLLKEVEALQQVKAVLTRNISCLFKTAQMELARKDKQMKELRDENLRFKLGGTRGPNNVRPHLTKAVSIDKISVQGKMTSENNHHNSSPVGTPDARSYDKPPHSQDSRVHYQSYTVVSNDRVAQGSLSIQLSNRGQTSQCHVMSLKTASEAAIVDTAHEQAVEMDSSEQSNRRIPDSLEGTKVSARIHEPDSDGHRKSSDEGKKRRSPSRGLLDSCYQHRDINPDGSRRTVGDSFNKQRGSSNDKEGRIDQQRDGRYDDNTRHADYGHTRGPERHRDSSRDRGRDRRVDGNLRNSDNRKRHRSVSRERDARPEDRESSRAAKAVNRSGSEGSRERQKDDSNRYHR